MLRTPASKQAARTAIKIQPSAPPIIGWNARDPFTRMKPGEAIRLDNWICRPRGLELRPGKQKFAFGLGASVESLLVYAKDGAAHRLFACAGSKIFQMGGDLAGVVSVTPSPDLTGLTNARWSGAMMSNIGGSYLLAVNGADGLRVFDGSTWSTKTVSSAVATRTVTAAAFSDVIIHQRRAWFIESGTLRVWYLGLDAIGGPAHPIDMAPLCREGGYIVAIASMSGDGGRNIGDKLVAVTSAGELLVWKGSTPAGKADTWGLEGVWNVSLPVGNRCFIRWGGDQAYLSRDGLLPLSQVLAKPDPEKPVQALTEPIQNAYALAYRSAPADTTWCMAESAHHRLMLVNVPTAQGNVQFVRSSDIGCGWSAFISLPALCWAECGDNLYFGAADGCVYRLKGGSDDGQPITALSIEAYSKYGTSARKKFSRVRPVFDRSAKLRARMEIRVNYGGIPNVLNGALLTSAQTYTGQPWSWGLVDWPLAPMPWSAAEGRGQVDAWRGITGHGHTASLLMAVTSLETVVYEGAELAVTTTSDPILYEGSEMAFETGGQI